MNTIYIRGIRLSGRLPDDSYISGLPVIQSLQQQGELSFDCPVTFLVGENGTGKSTLLEAIAVASGFNAEGGTRNFNFSTAHTESDLYKYLTIIKTRHPRDGFFLRAESLYNAASYLDELDRDTPAGARAIDSYGGVSLHEQSHGQSFLSLVQNRFGGHGLYILDEPEAALSPTRLMTLLVEIHRLVTADSQLIIATHSPILMTYPGASILELTEEGIRPTTYQKTDHYQMTRRFLENPEKMLHYLLDDIPSNTDD